MKEINCNIVELNKDVEPFVIQASRTRAPHYFKNIYGDKFKPLTFVHSADMHNAKQMWDRMVQYINYYKDYISFGLHTGDYCGGIQELNTDMYEECTPCERTIYNCMGNHDAVSNDEWSHPADKKKSYDITFKHANEWDVNFADCEYPMSYYKDFEESNIRMIVLDLYYDVWGTRLWLGKVLEDAKEKGLNVITAMHEPTDYIVESFGVYYHHADDYEMAQKMGEIKRTDGAFDHRGRVLFEDIIADFIERGGNYICNFAGHDHIDSFGLTEKGVLNVVVQNGTDWDELGDSRRVEGTKSYDCFNVVGIDTEIGVLKIIRIGDNVDHLMRKKSVLCFDYKNRKVVYQG